MSASGGRPGLRPAQLDFSANGHPVSCEYGDIYASRDGALEQARHVFLDGNHIHERLDVGASLSILELGFGAGLNLFATWQAKQLSRNTKALHYIAIEAHPLGTGDLRRVWQAYGIGGEALEQLAMGWPGPIRGRYRIGLADSITLTLIFDDVQPALRGLDNAVDAIYLDGFKPESNPAMWSQTVMASLANLALHDTTTVATYSVAGAVREGLAEAGFNCHLRPGVGRKRHCLSGRFERHYPSRRPPPRQRQQSRARIAVVGGGLAGSMIMQALEQAGHEPTWIAETPMTPTSASAQPAFAGHPHVSPDDNRLAQLTRAALSATYANPATSTALAGAPNLVRNFLPRLMLAKNPAEEERLRALAQASGLPHDFVQWLSRDEASARTSTALAYGGLWFERVPVLRRANDKTDATETMKTRLIAARVGGLRRTTGEWHLFDTLGSYLGNADTVVLALGDGANALLPGAPIGQRIRGQTSLIRCESLAHLDTVLGGAAYACPLGDGRLLVGASYDQRTRDEVDPGDDDANRFRLQSMFKTAPTDIAVTGAAVGYRQTSTDRLPWIGQALDWCTLRGDPAPWQRNDRLLLPRLPGLFIVGGFGSRGTLWSALAASLIVDLVDAGPTLLSTSLRDAVDPARFVKRDLRRGLTLTT